MRGILLTAFLTLAFVPGCLVEDMPNDATETTPGEPFQGEQFQGEPEQGEPAGTPREHGEPERDESSVETGITPGQAFGAYARKTVTITNDFGGATLGVLSVDISAGSIQLAPADADVYQIEAVLEARASTEQEARDALDRIAFTHEDDLQGEALHLTTAARYQPAATPVPVTLGTGVSTRVDVVYTVPASPAYDVSLDASSGDVSVAGLRGPSFKLRTSSGDVSASGLNAGLVAADVSSGDVRFEEVQAERLESDQSSGDLSGTRLAVREAVIDSGSGSIGLDGQLDSVQASASSGDITIATDPQRSGSFKLSASSGVIDLQLPRGGRHGYDVLATASSGSITIDLEGVNVEEDEDGERVRGVSEGFDGAAIQTLVEADSSSGDITVTNGLAGIL